METIALALSACLTWGGADFVGGLKSRKLSVLVVIFVSQAIGLAAIAAVLLLSGQSMPGGDFALYAALAGAAGAIGLVAFYRGMAHGVMSVVAPLSALSAIVPLTVGVISGDRPAALQYAGMGLALLGAALVSLQAPAPHPPLAPGEEPAKPKSSGAPYALIAAVGFGSFFVLTDAAGDEGILWVAMVIRIASLGLITIGVLFVRPTFAMSSADLGALAFVGVAEMAANTLFALAAATGLVSVAAVLASLYPVVTIALARFYLHEHLQPIQWAGIASVFAGVVAITLG